MKEKFIWTSDYSVGIQTIDEQHQHFFEIANNIIDLINSEVFTKEDLLAHIGELGDYALYHLSTEEGYFDKFGYENAKLHINAHNQYRETVNNYFAQIKDEKTDIKQLAGDVAEYSGNWLLKHIIEVDKKYTLFFQEHGLK